MSHSEHQDVDDEPGRAAPPSYMRALDGVRAPDSLRLAVAEMASEAAERPARRWSFALPAVGAPRTRLAGAGALVAAVAAIAVVLLVGGGGSSAPTVLQASRVALAPATLAAPAESPSDRRRLEASVEGLAYPYWGGRLGWPAAGARRDTLGGRNVTTVFYATHGGARIGYAIVAGPALPEPSAGTVVERGGVRFRVLSAAGAMVVTWREANHTCILAGRGVPAGAMLRLVSS